MPATLQTSAKRVSLTETKVTFDKAGTALGQGYGRSGLDLISGGYYGSVSTARVAYIGSESAAQSETKAGETAPFKEEEELRAQIREELKEFVPASE